MQRKEKKSLQQGPLVTKVAGREGSLQMFSKRGNKLLVTEIL